MNRVWLWILLWLVLTGCARAPETDVVATVFPSIESSPYAWSTPIPAPTPTSLDGLYRKVESNPATPVPCARCPDYKREGGEWFLWLDRGVFRVRHMTTDWRAVGSYTVSGNELLLFNDLTCPNETGRYSWERSGDGLTLAVVDDPCSADLRGRNLAAQPWERVAEN